MSKYNRHYNTLREIQKRRQQMQQAPQREAQTGLARYLDNLNAFGVLEAVQQNPPDKKLYFGPGDYRGFTPVTWAATVIWFRPPGYHNYKTITLLGVWAAGEVMSPEIVVGTRQLNFSAPFYNGESYFRQLRKSFETYYGKDAPPPEEANTLYKAHYESEKRLEMRQTIAKVIREWCDRVQKGSGDNV